MEPNYHPSRPRPPRPRRPRMSRGVRTMLLVVALVPVLTGAGVAAYVLTRHAVRPAHASDTEASSTTMAATVAVGPIRLRVVDLMRSAGCTGSIIGTQLYSYETGRCRLGAAEVTIAAFDTRSLRDQWVDVGKSFGGNAVVGDGWAAFAGTPEAAGLLVSTLNGARV